MAYNETFTLDRDHITVINILALRRMQGEEIALNKINAILRKKGF
jgi:hypothetical protein